MQRAGLISDLKLQVTFPLVVKEKLICKYIADFTYTENGKQVVEDVKGFKDRIYKLKKKLFETLFSLTLKET